MSDTNSLPTTNYKLQTAHTPVLLHETISGLAPKKGETILDATLGGAGHSKEFARAIGKRGTLAGIDLDAAALTRAKEALTFFSGKLHLAEGNFRDLKKILAALNVKRIDKILFDLGVSSFHYDESERGFSFSRDEPLKMTLGGRKKTFDAYDMVNEWDEKNLADVIFGYGGERAARTIARAIVAARTARPIKTSGELAEIVARAAPRRGKIHPATKTFQAIRIAVNDELGALAEALPQALALLSKKGRLAVISFHSLEDRIVKRWMKAMSQEGKLKLLTKRPVVPGREEIKINPRARSAKLRIAEKIEAQA